MGTKFTINDMKRILAPLEILSTEYTHANTPLIYKCECSEIATASYSNLCKGKRHNGCVYQRKLKRVELYHQVKGYFTSIGYELLSTIYIDKNSHLDCRCPMGHEIKMTYGHVKRGVRCSTCFKERNRGATHPSYKPHLTEEHRIKRRSLWANHEWSRAVKERDHFTCQVCRDDRGGNLVSHHINSYNKFPELRLLISNGITLCENCHKNFHNLFGHGNNTEDQWGSFLYYYHANKELFTEKEIIEKLAYFLSTFPEGASSYHKADMTISFLTRIGCVPPLIYDEKTEEFGNYWEPEDESN